MAPLTCDKCGREQCEGEEFHDLGWLNEYGSRCFGTYCEPCAKKKRRQVKREGGKF